MLTIISAILLSVIPFADAPADRSIGMEYDYFPQTYFTEGQTVHWDIWVSNTGDVDLTGAYLAYITSPDRLIWTFCQQPEQAILHPGERIYCYANYALTEADVVSGDV